MQKNAAENDMDFSASEAPSYGMPQDENMGLGEGPAYMDYDIAAKESDYPKDGNTKLPEDNRYTIKGETEVKEIKIIKDG